MNNPRTQPKHPMVVEIQFGDSEETHIFEVEAYDAVEAIAKTAKLVTLEHTDKSFPEPISRASFSATTADDESLDLVCSECGHQGSSVHQLEAADGDTSCPACFQKLFGPDPFRWTVSDLGSSRFL